MRFSPLLFLFVASTAVDAFGVLSYHRRYSTFSSRGESALAAEEGKQGDAIDAEIVDKKEADAEVVEKVGNLVADDQWEGFSMEMTELVRLAVVEDLKKNTREFTGKDDYKVGDVSKELDVRVKDQVAKLRGKDEYELGDFTMALDGVAKDLTMELTGKDEYEAGDLSIELDKRVKESVAEFCGKDEYELGDLSIEIDKRVKEGVAEFTGKGDYEFGDISREIEDRRRKWVSDVLGEEAAKNYKFGDLTKRALQGITGKDDYEFGDVTKTLMKNMFGGRKKKN